MCFDHDSRPPVAPIAGGAISGVRATLRSADGTEFSAFGADAERPFGAAMIVLPDVRGLHPYYEELALRFAEAGIDTVAIDYFGRTAGTTARGGDFAHQEHVAQTRYEQLLADVSAAAAGLRERHDVRALFTIGFCFGGRLSLLCATQAGLELAGAISFYGWPVGDFRAGMPAPADVAADMRVPVLALFGGADEGIPPEAVGRLRGALDEAGVENDVVNYDGAPHGFFDRKAEQYADVSEDAWRRVIEFVRRLTPSA